jgi:hypothetical protein
MQKWEYLRVCIENFGTSHSGPSQVYVIREDGILVERKKEKMKETMFQ